MRPGNSSLSRRPTSTSFATPSGRRPNDVADCDGRCGRAAGTNARLGDLTRFLTYHEHFGLRRQARENYAELTDEERNWRDADLEAAREACPSKLDFAQLLPEVDRLLG